MAETILGRASEFAIKAHGQQMYGRKPYHAHLIAVVQVLIRFYDWDELDQRLIDACWLHDTVEDCGTQIDTINALFTPRVGELVYAVTNPMITDKKARNLELYSKIRKYTGAINVKLADRIANVEQCISYDRVGRAPDRLFDKYSKAWDSFQSELRGHCRGEGASAGLMWVHLAKLIERGNAQRLAVG